MDQFSTWLAGAQVLAAFVTALATLALWRVTKVLARETSTLARMTSQPFVVCSLESSIANPRALDLVIRNTGNATAFDIEFRVSPALPNPDGSEPEDASGADYKVSLLLPEQRLPIHGVLVHNVSNNSYTASGSWAKRPASPDRESIAYQFRPEDGFQGSWRTKGLHQIGNELERIRERMEKT